MDRPAVLGGTPTIKRDAHRVWPIVGDEEKRAVMRVLDRGRGDVAQVVIRASASTSTQYCS